MNRLHDSLIHGSKDIEASVFRIGEDTVISDSLLYLTPSILPKHRLKLPCLLSTTFRTQCPSWINTGALISVQTFIISFRSFFQSHFLSSLNTLMIYAIPGLWFWSLRVQSLGLRVDIGIMPWLLLWGPAGTYPVLLQWASFLSHSCCPRSPRRTCRCTRFLLKRPGMCLHSDRGN